MEKLQKKIKIKFKDLSLYKMALTHRSFLNENKSSKEHNERLEFLWDAVLELSITKFLYDKFPSYPEWKLTNLRSSLVKRETLASVAREVGLWELLNLSKWEDLWWWRENDYILANTVEALIWAIYIDHWFKKADDFILNFIWKELDLVIETQSFIDSKSLIQSFVQAELKVTPKYKILHDFWPDHDKTFIVWVYSLDCCLWVWTWSSKQNAQQEAARNACEKFSLK